MCGICGEIRLDGAGAVSLSTIKTMAGLIRRRGPDAEGFYLADPPMAGLGHRRLSIIDLAGGKQPMGNEDGSVQVSFNGEIYNFKELRKDLVSRGHEFRTDSDTEVIAHQYEEDGPDCALKFNGMFALAIWDQKSRSLFLARDRLGIKPLYYAVEGARFLFASEIKPLLAAMERTPEIDPSSVWAYLAVQYAPTPRTLFKGISELGPGRRLVVSDGEVKEDKYWSLPQGPPDLRGREAEEELLELLSDSVRLRLIADVPLGAFLSGGIDSTTLVGLMRRHKGEGLKTFSVDFQADLGAGEVNETKWSSLAARTFATEHHSLTVSARDMIDALPEVVSRLDDLIADPAVIPTYLVSRFARQSVTVALSGEGGDELFGGYQRYALGSLATYYRPIPGPLRRLLFEAPFARAPGMRRVRKGLRAIGEKDPAARHLAWLLVMPPDLIGSITGDPAAGRATLDIFRDLFAGQKKTFDLDRTLRTDLVTWLPDDLLTKVDRASMAVGLEARVPFLDHRMVELALRIPPEEKIKRLGRKLVLKRAVKGLVPEAISAREKAGFTLPLDAWFRKELKEMVTDLLSPGKLKEDGLLDPVAAGGVLTEHLSGRENQGQALFSMMLLEMWLDDIKRDMVNWKAMRKD